MVPFFNFWIYPAVCCFSFRFVISCIFLGFFSLFFFFFFFLFVGYPVLSHFISRNICVSICFIFLYFQLSFSFHIICFHASLFLFVLVHFIDAWITTHFLSPVFHSPFPRHVLLNVYFYSQFTLNSRINAVLPSFFVFRFSPNLFISFFLSVLLLLTHSLTQSVSVSLSLSLCVELLSLKFTFRFSVTEVKTITTRKIINSFILIVLLTE